MRLFFALPLPDAARDAVAEALRPLRRVLPRAPGEIAWERRINLHITLRFLGETAADRLDSIVAAATPWVRRLPPPEIVLIGGGAFPDATRPRVLWLGVGPPGGLAPLAQGLEVALAPLGFAPDEHPYTPHLTVGRVRTGRHDRVAAELLDVGEVARFVPLEVGLFESRPNPDGPKYLPIHTFSAR